MCELDHMYLIWLSTIVYLLIWKNYRKIQFLFFFKLLDTFSKLISILLASNISTLLTHDKLLWNLVEALMQQTRFLFSLRN